MVSAKAPPLLVGSVDAKAPPLFVDAKAPPLLVSTLLVVASMVVALLVFPMISSVACVLLKVFFSVLMSYLYLRSGTSHHTTSAHASAHHSHNHIQHRHLVTLRTGRTT